MFASSSFRCTLVCALLQLRTNWVGWPPSGKQKAKITPLFRVPLCALSVRALVLYLCKLASSHFANRALDHASIEAFFALFYCLCRLRTFYSKANMQHSNRSAASVLLPLVPSFHRQPRRARNECRCTVAIATSQTSLIGFIPRAPSQHCVCADVPVTSCAKSGATSIISVICMVREHAKISIAHRAVQYLYVFLPYCFTAFQFSCSLKVR